MESTSDDQAAHYGFRHAEEVVNSDAVDVKDLMKKLFPNLLSLYHTLLRM